MTRLRIEDLPPKLRAQVLAEHAEAPTPPASDAKRETARPGPVRGSAGPGPAYRCHTCGETFPRWGAAAERHADAHHGARMDAVLERHPNPG